MDLGLVAPSTPVTRDFTGLTNFVAFLGTKLRSSGISHTIQTLLLVQEGKEGKASKW